MGYETKVFIIIPSTGENTGKFDSEGTEIFGGGEYKYQKQYGNMLCSVELGKSLMQFKTKPTSHYFYMDDGSTPLILDRYNKELGEMSLDEAIGQIIKSWPEVHQSYRVKILLDMLMSLYDKTPSAVVLTFGH